MITKLKIFIGIDHTSQCETCHKTGYIKICEFNTSYDKCTYHTCGEV